MLELGESQACNVYHDVVEFGRRFYGKPKGTLKKILTSEQKKDTLTQNSYFLPTAINRLPVTAVGDDPKSDLDGPSIAKVKFS
jgi:hypothetical protein